MSWGISENASDFEKLRAESADFLNGLNSCGKIAYADYDEAFDFYWDLLEKAYELGKESSTIDIPTWIPCSERPPKTDGLYLTAYRDFSKMMYKTHYFAHDLYKVDDLYFADKKGKSGWYSYDDEYGYFEFDAEAWMPIEPWEGSDDE